MKARVVPVDRSLPSPFASLGGQGLTFVSRDEVAGPEKLAKRGCAVMLFCSRSCVWRALKDFAAPALECRA